MMGKAQVPMPTTARATQHIRLFPFHDAYEHLCILTIPIKPRSAPPYAGRYIVASRFRCQPCGCGTLSEGFRRVVAFPPYLVGYVRWDARSGRRSCQTIMFNSFRSHCAEKVPFDASRYAPKCAYSIPMYGASVRA